MRRGVLFFFLLTISGGLIWSFAPQTGSVPPTTFAQADGDATCERIVRQALQQVGSACTELGNNEACYGHASVEIIPRDGIEMPTFSNSGDIVPLTDLAGIFTRPYDPNTETWGVALMSVQADLPEAAGDTMRFVLFGNTTVQDVGSTLDVPPSVMCDATNNTPNNINVRLAPNTESTIIDLNLAGETLTAIGRTDNGWLQVRLADGRLGYVFDDFYDVSCPADPLPLVDPALPPAGTAPQPMQVIQLTSGGPSPCSEAPNGLLVQAPEGQVANVVVNGIEMRFASSGFITVDEFGMTVTGLTGEITVFVPDGVNPSAPPPPTVATTPDTDNDPSQDVGVTSTESIDDGTDGGDGELVEVPFIDTVTVVPGFTTRIEFDDDADRYLPSLPDVDIERNDDLDDVAILRESIINRRDYDDATSIVTGDPTRIRGEVIDRDCNVGDVLNIDLPITNTASALTTGVTYLGGDKGVVLVSQSGGTLRVDCVGVGSQTLAVSVADGDSQSTSVIGVEIEVDDDDDRDDDTNSDDSNADDDRNDNDDDNDDANDDRNDDNDDDRSGDDANNDGDNRNGDGDEGDNRNE